jgi:hypothetical protein
MRVANEDLARYCPFTLSEMDFSMTNSGSSRTNSIRPEDAPADRERTLLLLHAAGTLDSKVLDAASGMFRVVPNFTTGTRRWLEGTAPNFAKPSSHRRIPRIEYRDGNRQENAGLVACIGVDPQTAPGAIESDRHQEEIRFPFGRPMLGAVIGDDHPRTPSDVSIRLNREIGRTPLRKISTSRRRLDPHAHATLCSKVGGGQQRKSHPQCATAAPHACTGAKNGPGSLPQECRK